jgi:hypothetical protein
MANAAAKSAAQSVVEQLEGKGVKRGILHLMAKDGQLTELRCEMPTCYCPNGRKHFDNKAQPMHNRSPNPDHSPILKMHGGRLGPDNVRLAHVLCNSRDFAWCKEVGEMLAAHKPLQEIAERLNKKKVVPPYGKLKWTARTVRSAYVS